MLEMENIARRAPLRNYFYSGSSSMINKVMIVAIIVSLLTVVLAPIVISVCAIIKIAMMLKSYTTDETLYDSIRNDDLEYLKTRATNVMGLVEEEYSIIEPIIGTGYAGNSAVKTSVESETEKKSSLDKVKSIATGFFAGILRIIKGNSDIIPQQIYYEGRDKKVRASLIRVVIIRFTEQQIVAYTCNYDIALGTILEEYVREVFYRDVDSVNYGADTVHVTNKEGKLLRYTNMWLRMSIPSRNNIVTSLSTENLLDEQVRAVKSLIRSKKEEMS